MVCRPGFENDPLERIRHSAAHLMASAVQELFPGTKVTIGPVIDDGFYYDFDAAEPFSREDLKKIEKKMQEIAKRKSPFERIEISRDEAIKLFQKKGEKFKVEIIEGLPEDETITLYKHGDWADLCKGPHVEHTGQIKAFKLLSVAGAYWRGDENREQLQRIYGTAFGDKGALKEYMDLRKEAAARDHRKLGKELDLFSSLEEEGAGLILWHPRGARIRNEIENYWRERHLQGGYDVVYSPHIAHRTIWQTSGHLEFYSENMFAGMTMENVDYQLKPMNCPFHIKIYNKQRRSYCSLPLRFAELGTVYRYERSGVLHGLLRVRGFTQDDAHIFCTPDQLESEVAAVLDLTFSVLKDFGFDNYQIYLSTRPEKYVGSDDDWDHATKSLEAALKKGGYPFELDPGEGVFYGPKIDIKITDSLKRSWQCSTVQVDFNLPKRFGVEYIGDDSQSHSAIMVHRALLGSMERFFGVLIEHYAGNFPLWLAPEQVRLLTISSKHVEYAKECFQQLQSHGIRVGLADGPETLGAKIRQAELMKIPYMAIIGDREVETGELSVRSKKTQGDIGSFSTEQFLSKLLAEISDRATPTS